MAGIIAAGAYVPLRRLQRAAMADGVAWFNPALAGLARGERAVANWDEDALTMAVEAARDGLDGTDRAAVARLLLASTTLPFADRLNAGIVKEALGLPDEIGALDVTGSQRAGTSALIEALRGGTDAPVLCIATDRRLAKPGSAADFINGDAAAAIVVGSDAPVADFLGSHSTTLDFVDRFRAADRHHDYEWESRWIRDAGYGALVAPAIAQLLERVGLTADQIDHVIFSVPAPAVSRQILKAAGLSADTLCDDFAARVGYAGCAQPLLQLADTLRKARAGDTILMIAFGQGVDVLAFRRTGVALSSGRGVEGWLARRAEETNYLRHLQFTGAVELDGGMRAELDLKTPSSMLYRERRTILSLTGGRCRETGTVQYPKSDVSVALNARMVGTQDDYPLAELGARVVTFTADHLGYSPSPPNCYGLIDFEGGGRMMVDFTDLEADLAVGDPVRMMFRLKRTDDRGFRHYFWKAVPAGRGSAGQEAVVGHRH